MNISLVLKYASDKPRNDKDVVFYAVKNYFYALEFASEELRDIKRLF